MNTTITTRRALVAAACAAAAVIPATAHASTPQRQTAVTTEDLPAFVSCDGFAGDLHVEQQQRITTFTDDAGNPVLYRIHVTENDVFSNSVTGKQVPVTATYTVTTTDFSSGVIHGVQGHAVIPGQGTVVLDAGRMTFTPDGLAFDGRFDLLQDGNSAKLCAALAS